VIHGTPFAIPLRRRVSVLVNEQTVIELHSEDCRCHGYAWNARRRGHVMPSACCHDSDAVPDGAVWVDSRRWLELGMPRTAEQYYRLELAHGNVIRLEEPSRSSEATR
jgi:hypothetical protein